jgi:aldehyde dehydrogenase (NAD+)
MQEEIFGPVLPVIPFREIDEAIARINSREKPLALYLFSRRSAVQEKVVAQVPFGGGCINDTIVHLASPHLPFGGVGQSGMGKYHGKATFDTFTHEKSVVVKGNWLDLQMRYPPYDNKKLNLIRIFLK